MTDAPWPADAVERRAIEALVPYARNARTHSDAQIAQIAASMREWGWTNPVLVDENGTILAGHGRVLAARQLGYTDVPVMIARGWSDAQRRAYVIADNKLALNADWDLKMLGAELQELDTSDVDMSLVGFTDSELAEILAFTPDDPLNDEPLSAPLALTDGPYTVEQIIELAFEHYRARSFPYPSMPLHECMQEINRLSAIETDMLLHSTFAYHVPDKYHPQRFSTPIPGKVTPLASFEDDSKLRHALRLCVEMAGRINDSAVLNACNYVRGAQCAAQFRPGFALMYARKYCPKGGVWLDTSAGWGGRIVGFAASSAARYIGIDPSSTAVSGNRQMASDLLLGTRVELIQKPAEDVKVSELGGAGSCDFAFTSPPYFGKEQYSDEPTQSYLRYQGAEAWREGFLLPMFALQYAALKRSSFSVVNIADVKLGGETVPLERWAVECGVRSGFTHVKTDAFPMPRTPGRGVRPERSEPCIVFQKP